MTGPAGARGGTDRRPGAPTDPGGARRVGAVLLGAAIVLVVAGLSRVPFTTATDADARLRLSWRMRGEAVEACRVPSAEELAELPVHMRNPEVCQRRGRSYRLVARADGRVLVDRTVDPSGARGDRPVYVFDEIPLPPGRHDVEVTFAPLPTGDAGTDGDDGPEEVGEGLRYRGTLEVGPREVVLVTLGSNREGQDRLEARTGPG